MKKILSKWWIWLLVVLFLLINLMVTNLAKTEEDNDIKKNRILEGNIDTH